MSKPSKTGVRGLFRSKDGRYHIDLRWREPSTGEHRRYRERLPPKMPAVAAKNRAREILAAALSGGFEPHKEGPKRFSQVLKKYLEWSEVNRPKTYDDRFSKAKILRAHIGDPRMDDLSAFQVERLKRDRKKAGKSPATINRDLAMLKHLCGKANDWGWMSRSVADAVRAVKLLPEPPGRRRYLRDDERKKLFGVLGKGLRPVVETALLSGMRLSEVITLRKSAVDLDRGCLVLTKTKNNNSRRLPVNNALANVLKLSMADNESDFVFLNTRGKPYTMSGVSSMFRKTVTRAGIEDFHFHDLRHDFATQVRRGGTGLDVIAALLGHSSLAMAQRYAHVGDTELAAAVHGLEAVTPQDAEVIDLQSAPAVPPRALPKS